MTEMIKQLLNHRSYRDFEKDYQVSETVLTNILKAAQQAPTWMNGQFYSMIVVKDLEKRKKLVEWNPGNPHMLNSSVFILFLADFKRTQLISAEKGTPYQVTGNLDHLITATTDAALAFENAFVAAESYGLGGCAIGSIRKNSREIIELFNLPEYTLPLFGLAIGKPTVEMRVKPRLPLTEVVHYDTYEATDYETILAYDDKMAKFGEARETKLWSKKFEDYFSYPGNPAYLEVLRQQKFL